VPSLVRAVAAAEDDGPHLSESRAKRGRVVWSAGARRTDRRGGHSGAPFFGLPFLGEQERGQTWRGGVPASRGTA
jgi:hypothetical protein